MPVSIRLHVNGAAVAATVDDRLLLADFLRDKLGLTGTHLGCEHGVCGACTILLDGEAVRSCLMLAAQADGGSLTTVEGLAGPDGSLHPLQEAFRTHHGLQCGFCTPGMLMSAVDLLSHQTCPTEDDIRKHMSGNLCRCTGYQGIVRAIQATAGISAKGGESA